MGGAARGSRLTPKEGQDLPDGRREGFDRPPLRDCPFEVAPSRLRLPETEAEPIRPEQADELAREFRRRAKPMRR